MWIKWGWSYWWYWKCYKLSFLWWNKAFCGLSCHIWLQLFRAQHDWLHQQLTIFFLSCFMRFTSHSMLSRGKQGEDREDTCKLVDQNFIATCWKLGVARYSNPSNSCSCLFLLMPFWFKNQNLIKAIYHSQNSKPTEFK